MNLLSQSNDVFQSELTYLFIYCFLRFQTEIIQSTKALHFKYLFIKHNIVEKCMYIWKYTHMNITANETLFLLSLKILICFNICHYVYVSMVVKRINSALI